MRDTGEIGYTYGRRGRGLFWRAVDSVLAFILEHTLSHVAGGRGGGADMVVGGSCLKIRWGWGGGGDTNSNSSSGSGFGFGCYCWGR